jgi:TM2 domain-containing membrane protein YozV
MKSKTTAYILLLVSLLGLSGFQRFYIGKIGTGLLWFFTFGLLGIGTIVDLFTLGNQVEIYNLKKRTV